MSDEMTADKLREQKEAYFNTPRFHETKRLQEEVFAAFTNPILDALARSIEFRQLQHLENAMDSVQPQPKIEDE